MTTEGTINEPEQSKLERDAHKWRLHQADHFTQGTPLGKPLTCDLNCPLRDDDDDDDDE